MIVHRYELFGFDALPRLHGSAVYKALLPSTVSVSILLIGVYGFNVPLEDNHRIRPLRNPYAIGVFIAFFTYLITFRANFAYGRYWEAATAVHQMLSKWLDVGTNMASYHYQCSQYQHVRPPSFGKHPQLKNLTRERERLQQMTQTEMLDDLEKRQEEHEQHSMQGRRWTFLRYHRRRKEKKSFRRQRRRERRNVKNITASNVALPVPRQSLHATRRQTQQAAHRPSQLKEDSVVTVSHLDGGVKTPSLFLQEGAHLLSLLSAVAMATLRIDLMDAEPPLVEYIPGRPWPPVDPDELSGEVRKEFMENSPFWTVWNFLMGMSRSDRYSMLYNEARPFRVLGGVSDGEMEELSRARGPYAKVSLCTKWLQEFVSREYMAGSTGGVAPPIISRLFQFTSDGMVGYNQARKVAYICFPFPHAQMTVLFIGVVVIFFPLLYFSFVNNMVVACILNFVTVMCFVGLHEVARELENPFRNVPNDLPLTTFQAEFNEALITMYAGFHPDSWWEAPAQDDASSLDNEDEDQDEPTVRTGGILKMPEPPIKESGTVECSD